MNHSADYLEILAALDIRVYVMSNGMTFVGECSDIFEDCIELTDPLRLEYDAEHGYKLSEAVPGNGAQAMIVYLAHVIAESKASLPLKNSYCDHVLMQKFADVINETVDSLNEDQQSFDPLVPKGSNEDYWNSIADRLAP
jgi:hypothetical protein